MVCSAPAATETVMSVPATTMSSLRSCFTKTSVCFPLHDTRVGAVITRTDRVWETSRLAAHEGQA
jgi:hypothetical protein